jgi:hypothetical protein
VFEKATPVPRDKEAFVGKWKSISGFTIKMKASGVADLSHNLSEAGPDYDRLCIKVGLPVIKDTFVKFKGDSTLEVLKPTLYAKDYRIECVPYQEDNHLKMVLNGVTLIRQ